MKKDKKSPSKKVFVALVIVASLLLIGIAGFLVYSKVFMHDNCETTCLKLINRSWTGQSLLQPNPETETREIKKGDIIKLEDSGCRVDMTILDIQDYAVRVKFDNTGGVTEKKPGGGISLFPEDGVRGYRTIEYNKEYELSTQTLDSGMTWILVFFF